MRNGSESRVALSPEKSALLMRKLAQQGGAVDAFPLSCAQKRLWATAQFDPHGSAYNIPTAVRFHGALNVAALQQAMSEVVRRHEILRTTFKTISGEPIQVVSPPVPVSLKSIKLIDREGQSRESQARRLAQEEAERPFDLERGPLMRVTLLQLDEDDHVLLLTMHHIISDAWSAGVFVREVTALYDACLKGEPSPLADLPIQYADFAVWQARYMQSEALSNGIDYWKRQLANAPALIDLPLDHPRPLVQSHSGATLSFPLDAELYDGLRQLSKQESATIFMTLLAAFKALLFRYTAQETIVVGTPVAGRTKAETEALIGFFVNALVLCTPMRSEESFRQLLRRVKDICVDAYAHQDTPFDRLLEELHPARSLSHSPLFQVMMSHQSQSREVAQLQRLRLSRMDLEVETAKFDLILRTIECESGAELRVHYRTDLFERATIEQMMSHYTRMLRGIVLDADRLVARLPILSAQEEQAIRTQQNRPSPGSVTSALCLHELFEEQARRAPDAVALAYGDDELSYGELNRRADRLARHLRSLGVGPESLVGMLVERSLEMIVGVLGILKAGGAYVPLDPAHPAERLSLMIADAGINIVLTQSFLLELLPEKESLRTECLDEFWNEPCEAHYTGPISRVTPDNAAYVIYTSGSTGRPKGVVVTHSNVTRLFDTTRRDFNFSRDDVWTLFHSYAFDFSVWELWGALIHGGCLVVVPYWVSRSPSDFYELLRRRQVTVLNQTPSAFRLLMAEDEMASDETKATPLALRLIIFGGEALNIESLKPWVERHGTQHPTLVNMYGITETTVHVTYGPLSDGDFNHVNGESRSKIGVSLDDLETYVLDPWLQPVPAKVAGELYVGGEGLARGYLRRMELTAERFIPNPFASEPGERLYRTGDLARRLPNGEFEYLGRIDHQVKVRGFRIELGEIEAVLRQDPSVAHAVVLLRKDQPAESFLTAYVVPAPETDCAPPELRKFLKQRLPDYMVPSSFVLLPKLPLTPNGKLDRAALPAPSSGAQVQTVSGRAMNQVESLLAEIWRDVLGVKEIGASDNFFEMGGDSIKAAVIVNRLQQRLQRIIHVVTIFDAPTIEQLAAYLEDHYGQAVDFWCGRQTAALESGEIATPAAAEEADGGVIRDSDIVEMRRIVEAQKWRRTPQRPKQKNRPALFVLSPPRSGSTLLRVMLGGHSQLFAPPELELLCHDTLLQRREALSGKHSFWRQGTIRALMQLNRVAMEKAEKEMESYENAGMSTREFYALLQDAIGDRWLVDKAISYGMDLETLRRAEEEFEGARYLHLARNPYAMIHSYEEAHLDQIFPRFEHGFNRRAAAELVWLVSHQNLSEFLRHVPQERQRSVQFEQLVREPEKVMRDICQWLGLEYEREMLEPYKEKQRRMTDGVHAVGKMLGDVKFHEHSGIDAEVAGRWRQTYREEFVSEQTWQVAEQLGYDRRRWSPKPGQEQEKVAQQIDEEPQRTLSPIVRVERDSNSIPLSFAQERLWFLNQLEPESPFYNCPAAIRLTGQLDVSALEHALSEIVSRHEVLRTSFKVIDDRTVQTASPARPITLPMTDLSALPEEKRENEARRLASEEARRPFDLAAGPMLRVRLIRMGDSDHLVLFTMHHIVSDGWSMRVFVREVAALYQAFLGGDSSPLPELPVQYADYAVWQRGWLRDEVWNEHLEYWKTRLRGKLPVMYLPADFERPATPTNRGAVEAFTLSADLTQALKNLSQQENVTLFMTMLAGFKTLLCRQAGESDVVVGTDIANRSRAETEGLIGFFINLLVLRTDLSGDPTFREVIRRVRETALGAYRHQEMPFEKVVEELRPQRKLSSAPFFQVVFGMHNVPRSSLELPGLKLSLLEDGDWTARFDLTVAVREQAEGLIVHWKYNTDLFQAATIRRLAAHYAALLASATAQPDVRISAQHLMSDDEKAEQAKKKSTREAANARKFKAIKPASFSKQDLSK
ncbi:MAG: amino acid adenylation domain-containing protein [Acidobacteriota bacterium]